MLRHTEAQLIFSLDRPRPFFVGSKGFIWFPEQESIPLFLPKMMGLERYYVPIQEVTLTSSEWEQLEQILGVGIPSKYRKLIEHALEHVVAFYCLKHSAPTPSELQERVRQIKETSEHLLKLSGADPVDTIGKQQRKQKSISRGTAHHVLSANQIVNQYLIHALPTKDRSLKEYLEPVRTLAQICEQGLQQIEKQASKRGPKTDTGLKYVVRVLVYVVCKLTHRTDHELPSPKTKAHPEVARYPLLAFVRAALSLGAQTAIQGLESNAIVEPLGKELANKLLRTMKDPTQIRGILDLVREYQLAERKRYA
jgi:hypothetical protein